MKKEAIKIKVDQTKLPNKFHFNVQLKERTHIFKNKKAYTRKKKYKDF